MKKSIGNYLISGMNLEQHTKSNRKQIMIICFKYLLGVTVYSNTYKELGEYGEHITFSRLLKTFDVEHVNYIIFILRKYAKQGKRESLVHNLDKKIIAYLIKKGLCIERIPVIKTIPSQEEVVEKYIPLITSTGLKIIGSIDDSSITYIDVSAELSIKAVQVYRTYIFNYGVKNWNDNVFYSCIIKGIKTKSLDIISSFKSKKRSINSRLISFDKVFNYADPNTITTNCSTIQEVLDQFNA